ncbi:MAG TPA: ATP-binding protein, partial [Longimicrobium sp.]|nr:ATP-binding protein [Longimicrobium sp.]
MDRDSLLRALRTTFADELTDQLRGLSGELVALEQAATPDERAELVRSLFRRAHGLKGAARAADVTPVEHACHALETLLGLVRDRGRSLDEADFEALFTTIDALEDVGQQLRADPLARVESRLLDEARSALSVRAEGAPPPEPSRAGSPDDATAPAGEPAPAAEPLPDAAPPPGPTPAGTTARATLSDYDVVAPQTQETGGGEADAAPPAEPAAAEPKPDGPPAAPGRVPQEAIRVSSERLDALSLAGGELLPFVQRLVSQAEALELLAQEVRELQSRSRRARASALHSEVELDPALARIDRRLMRLANQATGDGRGLGQVVGRLRSDIRELRLVPWSGAAGGLLRSARALLKEHPDKDARVEVEDSGLELDQSVVATLRELLPHLVHNAIDHGIEPMDERTAQGKPPQGTVRIRAMMNHDRVEVDVEDDGRGLDPAKLAAEAERRGLRVPSSPERALELIFHPGFSTAAAVTTTSGRGVGLDLV